MSGPKAKPTTAIGKRILAEREALGLSMRKLAALADVGPSTLSVWGTEERASKPHDVVARVARALNVTSTWLTTGQGPKQPTTGDDPRSRARHRFLEDAAAEHGDRAAAEAFVAEYDQRAAKGPPDRSAWEWQEIYRDAFRAWRRARKSGGSPFGAGVRVVEDEDEEPLVKTRVADDDAAPPPSSRPARAKSAKRRG